MIFFVLLCVFALCVLYFWYTAQQQYKRFAEQDVLYLGSFTANLIKTALTGEHVTANVMRRYHRVKEANKKFAVELEFGTPSYFITDVDLIKHVLVKDFDHFVNPRKITTSKKNDDLISRMLITREGNDWRALRSKMSPTFSTGKIKRMFRIMNGSGKKFVDYVNVHSKEQGGVLNIQEGFSKFTMDFISTAAFALDTKSFETTAQTVFEEMASHFQFKLSAKFVLKLTTFLIFPRFSEMIGLSLFSKKAQNFFRDVITSTIKVRDANPQEKRDDFLELMLEARNGTLKQDDDLVSSEATDKSVEKWTLDDDDIAAQCVIFIAGGADTVRNALQFAAYNLAIYPEVQERLFQELRDAVDGNHGEFSYEIINGLKYLDQVISESLRIYPIATVVMRTCTKEYQIPDSKAVISKGSIVQVPIYCLHHDPNFFPNPDNFDPERFSAENKPNIPSGTYMPFGQGPRHCIAMRLALMQVKACIAHLVLNFTLEPSEKTNIPMKFAKSVMLNAEGELFLNSRKENRCTK